MSLRPLRVLIADDEPVARQVLREEIELQPDVELVGEAADRPCGTRCRSLRLSRM